VTARGRPWKERQAVLNGILEALRAGAPWVEVPDRYPSYQTCHRRFQQWVQSGVMRGILEAIAAAPKIHGLIDVEEAFIDGSFAPSKKGGSKIGKTSKERGRKSWLWQTGMVSPLSSVSRALLLTR
jgi:transposase